MAKRSRLKRMKKSSIVFMLILGLMVSSVTVYAATDFSYLIAMNRTEYTLSTVKKTTAADYVASAYLKLDYSDVPSATTVFRIRSATTGTMVCQSALSLPNTNLEEQEIPYSSAYVGVVGNMNLTAITGSAHYNYTVRGEWNPNG